MVRSTRMQRTLQSSFISTSCMGKALGFLVKHKPIMFKLPSSMHVRSCCDQHYGDK